MPRVLVQGRLVEGEDLFPAVVRVQHDEVEGGERCALLAVAGLLAVCGDGKAQDPAGDDEIGVEVEGRLHREALRQLAHEAFYRAGVVRSGRDDHPVDEVGGAFVVSLAPARCEEKGGGQHEGEQRQSHGAPHDTAPRHVGARMLHLFCGASARRLCQPEG